MADLTKVNHFPVGILLIALSLGGGNALSAPTAVLDGMVFVGKTGEQGGQFEEQNELVFKDGKLYSSSCASRGFGAGEYETLQENGQIRFRSIIHSPEQGEILWQGTVNGKVADATYIWTRERWWWKDVIKRFWFIGQLRE